MPRAIEAVRARGAAWALALLALATTDVAAQSNRGRLDGADRWFVVSTQDQATQQPTLRMLYLGRDGTVLIVQCAARDGRKTGGWALTVRRDDWYFPTDFLQGWWSVDSEPTNGPSQWGGTGALVLLKDDALKARMLEPIETGIVLRVAQGSREWEIRLAAQELTSAVGEFAPTCEAT